MQLNELTKLAHATEYANFVRSEKFTSDAVASWDVASNGYTVTVTLNGVDHKVSSQRKGSRVFKSLDTLIKAMAIAGFTTTTVKTTVPRHVNGESLMASAKSASGDGYEDWMAAKDRIESQK